MKVIKQGVVIPKNRITCGECGCIFEYDTEDIETVKQEWTEFDHSLYMNEYHCTHDADMVKCPTCGDYKTIGTRNHTSKLIPFSKRFMGGDECNED